MKLIDKFHQWLKTEPRSNKENPSIREAQCVVIAEEFAMEFAHFLRTNCQPSSDYLTWCYRGKYYNEGFIFEIFKEEKGL